MQAALSLVSVTFGLDHGQSYLFDTCAFGVEVDYWFAVRTGRRGGVTERRAESLWWSSFENGLRKGSPPLVPAVVCTHGNPSATSLPTPGCPARFFVGRSSGSVLHRIGEFWLNLFSILLVSSSFRRLRESGWVIVVSVCLLVTSAYSLNSFYTPVSAWNFLLFFYGLALHGLRNYG